MWEVVGRLMELDGSEEHRIAVLAEEADLHPRLIRLALDYVAVHRDEVLERIEHNRQVLRMTPSSLPQPEPNDGPS
ncbi:hypothetical protein ACQBAU_04540 [Propionibacteriaceae bacterium Y2011]